MGKHKKKHIGRRKKEKRYDKEAREKELEKIEEENFIMVKKEPKKSIFKKYSNIPEFQYEPEPTIIDIMNMDGDLDEKNITDLIKVEKKESIYCKKMDPSEPPKSFVVGIQQEHLEQETQETINKSLLKKIKYIKRCQREKSFKLKKYYMLNTMRKFSDLINDKVKDGPICYNREEHKKLYSKLFTYRAFKAKYLKFKGLSKEEKTRYNSIYKSIFKNNKPNFIEKMMDFDLIIYYSNRKKKVKTKNDYDYNCLGNFDEKGIFIEEKLDQSESK